MRTTDEFPRAAFGTARTANWYVLRGPALGRTRDRSKYSERCLALVREQLAALSAHQGALFVFREWLLGTILFPSDLTSPHRLFALIERTNKIHSNVPCENGPSFSRCLNSGDPDTFYTCPNCGDGLCPDCHDGPFTYCIRCTSLTER